MKPIHAIAITDINGVKRTLQICVGDVTAAESAGEVDVLAISCFPDDYLSVPGTIVGQLEDCGIDVGGLAKRKAVDDRGRWQTWISEPLGPDSPFGHIACFEHGFEQHSSAVVGNLFRSLAGFVLKPGVAELRTIRVPLLSTGDQGADKSVMLDSIVRQAYNQLRAGLPAETVQIVLHSGSESLHELIFKAALTVRQVQDEWAMTQLSPDPIYDYFVSYRRVDRSLVDGVLDGLRARCPGVRVFLDQQALPHGVFWKPELLGSIYNSRKFLCFITDSYADSGECVDEFHTALNCGRYRGSFLRPLLQLSTRAVETLPPAFRSVNLIEANCPPRRFNDVLDAVLTP